mmetsp:Transcript_59938/g.131398  ORF Transcript_59938/g.131398 Transcript_59938/m.131398 type:complete len:253 (-) Transcript_59938:1240-1998(-)
MGWVLLQIRRPHRLGGGLRSPRWEGRHRRSLLLHRTLLLHPVVWVPRSHRQAVPQIHHHLQSHRLHPDSVVLRSLRLRNLPLLPFLRSGGLRNLHFEGGLQSHYCLEGHQSHLLLGVDLRSRHLQEDLRSRRLHCWVVAHHRSLLSLLVVRMGSLHPCLHQSRRLHLRSRHHLLRDKVGRGASSVPHLPAAHPRGWGWEHPMAAQSRYFHPCLRSRHNHSEGVEMVHPRHSLLERPRHRYCSEQATHCRHLP